MTDEITEIVGPAHGLVEPRFAGFRTFAKLPRLTDVPRCDVAVLGAPFDSGTGFRSGARFGPAAIREASMLLRTHNYALGVSPFEAKQVVDAGDAPASPVIPDDAFAAIEASAAELWSDGARVIGIGGDHSVALPFLRAAAGAMGKLGLVHLDAHTDTNSASQGSKYTHGTVFRRAAEEGLLDTGRAVQIGLRGSTFSADALQESTDLGYRQVLARRFDVDEAIAVIEEVATGPTYVTIDIDVLDPAFGGLSSTPEIGGLTSADLLELLRALANMPKTEIVAGDVVEVAPAYDPAGIAALVGANLAFELVSLVVLAL